MDNIEDNDVEMDHDGEDSARRNGNVSPDITEIQGDEGGTGRGQKRPREGGSSHTLTFLDLIHHPDDCSCCGSNPSGSDDSFGELGRVLPKQRRVDTEDALDATPETSTSAISSQPPRRQFDLRPEILRALSPRTLHRTLMEATKFDTLSDVTTSSSWFGDSDGPAQSPPHPQVVEYEVGYISPEQENPNPVENMTSTSNEDDDDERLELSGILRRSGTPSSPLSAGVELPNNYKAMCDEENLADSSDSDSELDVKSLSSDSDAEESGQGKQCTKCNAKTENQYFLYCPRCFHLRRDWLPKRPKGHKARPAPKVHRKRLRAAYTCSSTENYHANAAEISISCSSPDQGSSSSNSSSNSNSLPSTSTSSGSSGSLLETELRARASAESDEKFESQPPLDDSPVAKAGASPDDNRICIICRGREINSAFVHRKIAHFCCCFTCGDTILKRTGKCPVCRKKILRVVKIIV